MIHFAPLHDAVNGGAGADVLTSTAHGDVMTGGAGDDIFVFLPLGTGAHDTEDSIADFGAIYFTASLSGAQEAPAVATTATGTFTATLSRAGALNFLATVTGLDLGGGTAATADDVTAAHFHLGGPGVAGGVVFGFVGVPNNETANDTVTIGAATVKGKWDAGEGNGTTLAAQTASLLAGQLYVNFHTSRNPGGEIRGQLLAQDAGRDRIDVKGAGIATLAEFLALTTDINGSADLALPLGVDIYHLRLDGTPKASLTAADFIFADASLRPQVAGWFSNIHAGRAALAPDQTAINILAQQRFAGQLTQTQLMKAVVDTADAETAVAAQAYQFFTGATPTQAGLAFLVASATNPTDLNDAYYAKFSLENRYINFAANLGIAGQGAAAFQADFGGLSFLAAVQLAYGRIIGLNYAAGAGINATAAEADIAGRLSYFQQVAREGSPGANQDLATKAAMVGYILGEGIKADVGAYAAASNAFLTDLLDGTAQFNVNLVGTYAPTAPTGH